MSTSSTSEAGRPRRLVWRFKGTPAELMAALAELAADDDAVRDWAISASRVSES